ncbi:SDR family NAD(P)-dependent oxidoreductase [Sphingobacterium pedocola]|nr:SDR family NAD(P)-dependent oxidoreductase [Sphingobacterium pedocola]
MKITDLNPFSLQHSDFWLHLFLDFYRTLFQQKIIKMDLKNSTILITGGTSGIRLEFVKQLTEIGAKVIVTGRKQDALDEARKQFPNVHTFQSDVSKPAGAACRAIFI